MNSVVGQQQLGKAASKKQNDCSNNRFQSKSNAQDIGCNTQRLQNTLRPNKFSKHMLEQIWSNTFLIKNRFPANIIFWQNKVLHSKANDSKSFQNHFFEAVVGFDWWEWIVGPGCVKRNKNMINKFVRKMSSKVVRTSDF